jgi:hypothetical protein
MTAFGGIVAYAFRETGAVKAAVAVYAQTSDNPVSWSLVAKFDAADTPALAISHNTSELAIGDPVAQTVTLYTWSASSYKQTDQILAPTSDCIAFGASVQYADPGVLGEPYRLLVGDPQGLPTRDAGNAGHVYVFE